ncbi:MAG: hypothetical protein K6G91_13375 [Kiritimatiellae bacterium]|nr:hypothetical protein [Kiritimatiellia bacterium]
MVEQATPAFEEKLTTALMAAKRGAVEINCKGAVVSVVNLRVASVVSVRGRDMPN